MNLFSKKMQLSLKVAGEIDRGEWAPVWCSNSKKYLKIKKKGSNLTLWTGNGVFYCEMYDPVEYNPFGIVGKIIVYIACIAAIKKQYKPPKCIPDEQSKVTASLWE